MKALLAAGAKPDAENSRKVRRQSLPQLRFCRLLTHGWGLQWQHVPILGAAINNQVEACRLLLDAGASVNHRDEDQYAAVPGSSPRRRC